MRRLLRGVTDTNLFAKLRQPGVLLAVPLLVFSGCGGSSAAVGTPTTPVAIVTPSNDAPTPQVTPTPTPTPSTPPPATVDNTSATKDLKGIAAEGDSISVFWAGSYTGIYAKTHPATPFYGLAVGGAGVNDVRGGNGLVQRLPQLIEKKPAIVTILIGANDLIAYSSASTWLDALWSYVADVKATGAKVVVGTVLPICLPQHEYYNTQHKARRPIVNEAIRAAVGTRIDGVFDLAADPTLGPDAAACDTQIFADGLHPSDRSQEVMAGIYTRALDKLL